MGDKLPPNLAFLFQPRPPVRYLPPSDFAPEDRRTAWVPPDAPYVKALKEHEANDDASNIPESWLERKNREHWEKSKAREHLQTKGYEDWKTSEDANIFSEPLKTVFVGRIPFKTTERDLERAFGRFGAIRECRVVYKVEKPKDSGDEVKVEDGHHAKKLNGDVKSEDVDQDMKDTEAPNASGSGIVQTGLDKTDDDVDMLDAREATSDGTKVKKPKTKNKKAKKDLRPRSKNTTGSRGYGFVRFEHQRDAEEAIRKMNGTYMEDRKILVDAVRGKGVDKDFRPHLYGGTVGGRHHTKVSLGPTRYGYGGPPMFRGGSRGGFGGRGDYGGRGGFRGGRGGGRGGFGGPPRGPPGAPAGPRPRGGGPGGPRYDDRDRDYGGSGGNMEPLGGRDRGYGRDRGRDEHDRFREDRARYRDRDGRDSRDGDYTHRRSHADRDDRPRERHRDYDDHRERRRYPDYDDSRKRRHDDDPRDDPRKRRM